MRAWYAFLRWLGYRTPNALLDFYERVGAKVIEAHIDQHAEYLGRWARIPRWGKPPLTVELWTPWWGWTE